MKYYWRIVLVFAIGILPIGSIQANVGSKQSGEPQATRQGVQRLAQTGGSTTAKKPVKSPDENFKWAIKPEDQPAAPSGPSPYLYSDREYDWWEQPAAKAAAAQNPASYHRRSNSYATNPDSDPPRYVRKLSEIGVDAFKDVTWLEIGFGGGEHLASDAQAHPRILFIGCEPFVNGVAKLVSTIDEKTIQNILIHDGDALEILRALPDASLGRVTILYPDPWPKFGQRKRRFISPETIQQMARTLRDGEEVRFATDIDDYSGWTLARFQASESFDWKAREAKDWTTPWAGWPGTRYEAKAFREGRTPAYLTFVRKARC